ncbi:hypothetical protein WJX72_008900 [[Myrmecia] bisecta]|uniref:S-acyltransferase n=1 Tax=[Myrmecia] bisecta TaxID=41462 RepID=A0AAW1PSY4_9CHLO
MGHRLGCLLAVLTFTALVAMLLWSYFATVIAEPGGVPPGWHPFADEEAAMTQQDYLDYPAYPVSGQAMMAKPRYCKKCKAWKPLRAHHDSISGRCVLKMDHYCIWVVNCVGLLNYKHFLLFLFWTCAACLEAAALLITSFVQFLTDSGQSAGESAVTPAIVFVAFVIDAAFFISLLGFLIMHARMVARNSTSIEMYEKAGLLPHYPHDRGFRENFKDVFGPRSWWWLIPHYTPAERRQRLEQALQPQAHEMSARTGGGGAAWLPPLMVAGWLEVFQALQW